MYILAYIFKTKAFRANLTQGKIVDQVNFYLPWNFSDESDNLLLGCCPWIGNFKEILQILVIFNIIIDRDKL